MATEIGDLTSSGTIGQTRRSYRPDGSKVVEYTVATTDEGTFLGTYTIGTSTDDGLTLSQIDVLAYKGVSRVTLNYVTGSTLARSGIVDATSQQSDSTLGADGPVATYTYTSVVSSFDWSQGNIIEDVGDLGLPTGMTSAVITDWRKTGKSVVEMGDNYVITETWEYENT